MSNPEELAVASALELLRGGSDTSSPPQSGAASIKSDCHSNESSACSTPACEVPMIASLGYGCAPGFERAPLPPSAASNPSSTLATPVLSTVHSRVGLNQIVRSTPVSSLPSASASSSSLAPCVPSTRAPKTGAPRRGRISGMLLTATSYLINNEARIQLQHLVRMLRLANDHLSAKVERLRESMDADTKGVEGKMSASAVKQDIINTVRKCLKLLSTFASNKLPERARFAVRGCLLNLPNQWAHKMSTVTTPNTESAVLSLATETLGTLQNVINILDEVLGKAESWCNKKPSGPANNNSATVQATEPPLAVKQEDTNTLEQPVVGKAATAP